METDNLMIMLQRHFKDEGWDGEAQLLCEEGSMQRTRAQRS